MSQFKLQGDILSSMERWDRGCRCSKANVFLAAVLAAWVFYFLLIARYIMAVHPYQLPKEVKPVSYSAFESLIHLQQKTIQLLRHQVIAAPNALQDEARSNADVVSLLLETKAQTTKRVSFETSCDSHNGLQLAARWRNAEETWCSETYPSSEEGAASLKCFPYSQFHRKGKDVLCIASNFVVDFTKKRSGDAGNLSSPSQDHFQYYLGALSARCKKTPAFQAGLFSPLQSSIFSSFTENNIPSAPTKTEETATYLHSRNIELDDFASNMADFMNIFLATEVLDQNVEDQQILLWDHLPDGPALSLLQQVFAPIHKVHRISKYTEDRVLFRRLIFHMDASSSLLRTEAMTSTAAQHCRASSFFDAFRRHMLHYTNLLAHPAPIVPTIAYLPYSAGKKHDGGIIDSFVNEDDVRQALLSSGNMMRAEYYSMKTRRMSWLEQMSLVRRCNVLVGRHGVQLHWLLFAADEAVLVEIIPSYVTDRTYRLLARLLNKDYLPVRSIQRETCSKPAAASENPKYPAFPGLVSPDDNVGDRPPNHASAHNDSRVVIHAPITDMIHALDGACRLARSYDSGVVECGLLCSKEILAMDDRLDGYYQPDISAKGQPLSRTFPCVVA